MTTSTTTDAPTTTATAGGSGAEHQSLNPVIHAAFRRDLGRLDDGLARVASGSSSAVTELLAAWDWFALQLHTHHGDEEQWFWPAFRELGVDGSLMAELEGEHVAMVAALGEAEAAMERLRATGAVDDAAGARHAVLHLRDVLCDHLAHEERDLDPFSTEHHATKLVKAAVRSARKAHTEGAGSFFAWLGDTDDPHIARALRREVPAPVLFVMTRIGGRRYRRIANATSA